MNENGPVKAVDCTCLKEKLGTVVAILEEDLSQRSEVIPIQDIFMIPLKCQMASKKSGTS